MIVKSSIRGDTRVVAGACVYVHHTRGREELLQQRIYACYMQLLCYWVSLFSVHAPARYISYPRSRPPPAYRLPHALAGGGAIEMIVSRHLKEYSRTVEGKAQIIVAAFARALELIPSQLADNAGFDSTDILNHLRQKHAQHEAGSTPCWWGVDIAKESICNTFDSGVWEPAASKVNSFASATEAACLILSVDETVKNAASDKPQAGPMGRGAPMSAAMGGAGMRGMMSGRGRGVRMMQGELVVMCDMSVV